MYIPCLVVPLQSESHEDESGCQFNRLKNRLKNSLRCLFDSVTCLNYPFLEISQWFFKLFFNLLNWPLTPVKRPFELQLPDTIEQAEQFGEGQSLFHVPFLIRYRRRRRRRSRRSSQQSREEGELEGGTKKGATGESGTGCATEDWSFFYFHNNGNSQWRNVQTVDKRNSFRTNNMYEYSSNYSYRYSFGKLAIIRFIKNVRFWPNIRQNAEYSAILPNIWLNLAGKWIDFDWNFSLVALYWPNIR